MSWFSKAFKSLNPKKTAHMPRRAARHATSGFSCPLGEVLDVSSTGMKVFCHKRPAFTKGQVLSLCLQSPFQKVALRAAVAWTRQVKLGVHHMGLRFVDLQAGMGEVIENMARYGYTEIPHARPGNRSASGKTASVCADAFKFSGSAKAPQNDACFVPLQASASFEDYYSMFGLKRSASEEEIQKAYRVLARRYHPDLSKEPETAKMFQLITDAYHVLNDPERRKDYDAGLRSRAA